MLVKVEIIEADWWAHTYLFVHWERHDFQLFGEIIALMNSMKRQFLVSEIDKAIFLAQRRQTLTPLADINS